MALLPARIVYSRAERWSDAAVHILGLVGALVAVPALVLIATMAGAGAAAVTGVAIYGACLTAMLVCSALYNMVPEGRWTGLLRRLDHSAIYFKIAGTYTPFTLLTGGAGAGLLTALWSAALAGTGLRVLAPNRTRWICLGLYLGMGWAGLLAGSAFFEALSPGVIALILLGGVIYTAGVAFYLLERLPFHNTIWHAFVLVASGALYAAITMQLLATTAQA